MIYAWIVRIDIDIIENEVRLPPVIPIKDPVAESTIETDMAGSYFITFIMT